jgi:hypothetical protein
LSRAVFCFHHTTEMDGLCPTVIFLFLLRRPSFSFGITVRGGPQPLSKLSSTVLHPATYVSNSWRSIFLDPQLTQATSTWVFRYDECPPVYVEEYVKECESHLSNSRSPTFPQLLRSHIWFPDYIFDDNGLMRYLIIKRILLLMFNETDRFEVCKIFLQKCLLYDRWRRVVWHLTALEGVIS